MTTKKKNYLNACADETRPDKKRHDESKQDKREGKAVQTPCPPIKRLDQILDRQDMQMHAQTKQDQTRKDMTSQNKTSEKTQQYKLHAHPSHQAGRKERKERFEKDGLSHESVLGER